MISKEVNRTSNTSCERLSLAEYIEKVVLAQRSKDVNTKNEKNVLFIGEKSSGKSSLLNVLLGRKEKTSPTIAPSFDVAVKDDARANIWEMGQVVHHGIAGIPMNMDKPKDKVIVVIVLDLSKPENVVPSLTQWFAFLRRTASNVGDSNNHNTNKVLLLDNGRKEDSSNILDDLPFEVLIVGNKYDKFKNEESVKRKLICSALRYFTFISNSYLMFASTRDKTARDNFKNLARDLVFSSESGNKDTKMKQNIDESKGPLLILTARYDCDTMGRRFDCMERISESLPDLTINKNHHNLFQNCLTREVVKEWVVLSHSILGKDSFELDHTKAATELRNRLKSSSNKKIDTLREEAEEEVVNIRRMQAIEYGLVSVDS